MAGKSYKLETGQGKLGTLLADAFSEVEELGNEVRERSDNMEGSGLGSTPLFDSVNEAADELEQHTSAPDIPKANDGETDLASLDVAFYISVPKNKKQSPSRQVRLENACAQLSAIVDALTDYETDNENDERAGEFCDEIQDHLDALETVEIPGMYG